MDLKGGTNDIVRALAVHTAGGEKALYAGGKYADCNWDAVLNLGDFGCFQTKFALGCP